MLICLLASASDLSAQDVGSIRGIVYDADFEAPLPLVEIKVVELDLTVLSGSEGNYLISDLAPGTYTLLFTKSGYARIVRSGVQVSAGRLNDQDASLSGEFTEMDEFVVEEFKLDSATELGLLRLRFETPALMDSIGAELMSRAGASDAASALKLVSGASVQDGKYAVIRGLPDRYVNSQLSGVRLPTADAEKRAVQLDQYPSTVIESIQVSKTFTPDQQGDASGGAVNVILKGIPDENFISLKTQYTWNSQTSGRSDFLTFKGAGFESAGPFGLYGGDSSDPYLGPQQTGTVWDGAVGTTTGSAPIDWKLEFAMGGRIELEDDVTVGAFYSHKYEEDSQFFDNGIDDQWSASTTSNPGVPFAPGSVSMTPTPSQASGSANPGDEFLTSLNDVTQGTDTVQWGSLFTGGIEFSGQAINASYLYTKSGENQATLAENTRGKQFVMDEAGAGIYVPDDPTNPGNVAFADSSPYLRQQTSSYTKRTTETFILDGEHELPAGLKLDWTYSQSTATLSEAKTQFGSKWFGPREFFGFLIGSGYVQLRPAATSSLGNIQHIYKDISERSNQYAVNSLIPFTFTEDELEGSFKFGLFSDRVNREFVQDTYSGNSSTWGQEFGVDGPSFDTPWTDVWPNYPGAGAQTGVINGSGYDVNYTGAQDIDAFYGMVDLPLTDELTLVTGIRSEYTSISTNVTGGPDAVYFAQGQVIQLGTGNADVDYSTDWETLPSINLELKPNDVLTLRGAYSQTLARQTFRELTPVLQQEYLGGPIYIGNPDLQMSRLKNYDLRLDYTPYEGGLVSLSGFYKDLIDPIENVQFNQNTVGNYTTPVNFPSGKMRGIEFEVRQDLGTLLGLEGFSIGGNLTLIDSKVDFDPATAERFRLGGYPQTSQPMTGAPEYMANVYLNFDLEQTGTAFSIFYTNQGRTMISGASVVEDIFIPAIYEVPIDSLVVSVSQRIFDNVTLEFKAKNLTNPEFRTVYSSDYIDRDYTYTSFTKGIDLQFGVKVSFDF